MSRVAKKLVSPKATQVCSPSSPPSNEKVPPLISTIIDEISLSEYATYSSTALQGTCRINNMLKLSNSASSVPIEVTIRSFDVGRDGKYNGVGLVEISNIFAAQDEFFFRIDPYDRVYDKMVSLNC